MNEKNILLTASIAAVMALGLTGCPKNYSKGETAKSSSSHAGMEKCSGIVKAGRNDCGTSKHACAGKASSDGAAEEWVYLPKGTCNKITGGHVKS